MSAPGKLNIIAACLIWLAVGIAIGYSLAAA